VRTGYVESATADKAVPMGLWRSIGMNDSFDLRHFVMHRLWQVAGRRPTANLLQLAWQPRQ
jgi:hypothetical protein